MRRTNPFDPKSPYDAFDLDRRQRLLSSILSGLMWAIAPIIFVFGFIFIVNPSWQIAIVFGETLLLLPISMLSRHWSKNGHALYGSYLILFFILVITGGNGLLLTNLIYAVAPAYTVILVMAGMLLNTRDTYIFALVAAFFWIVVWNVAANGLIMPAPGNPSLFNVALIVIVVSSLLFTAFMSQLATSDLRRALTEATFDLVKANEQLEKASRLKSQFTARTSHELRTPLSAIIVFTDLALRKVYGALDIQLEESLHRILRNAKRLLALIEDILDLSKIEAGEVRMVEQVFQVARLVESVQNTLEPVAQQKNIRLSLQISPDMPRYILGDEKRLTQVLMNLTDNAVKFTNSGGVDVQVESLDEDQWQMVVKDSGRGMNEKEFDTIFEEFRQLDISNTGGIQGTGLGLSITHHLVELMNGRIRLESEIGKGSMFWITFPLKRVGDGDGTD